jgi:purine-binding chemotaxis protein CheW
MENQILVFQTGNAFYGIDVTSVQEVSRMPDITTIPQTAPHVLGMCSNRGALIPIVDLTCKLSNGRVPATLKEHLMVITFDKHTIGSCIDIVYKIIKVNDEDIQPYPYQQNEHPGLVKGVFQFDNKLVAWLDSENLGKLLIDSDDEHFGIGNLDVAITA